MDFMADMAELALASRLRRLSDYYWQNVTATYRKSGLDFDVRWATVFVLIARQGPVAVMEIAERLGITHPAVIQVTNELEKHKLIVSTKSERDGRKRFLTLSEDGRAMLPKLQPLWDAFITVNHEMLASQQHNLLTSLQEMENQLAERGFFDRVQDQLNRDKTTNATSMDDISIVTYSPAYQPDFKRLNVEWIEKYFRVEPHDLEQLEHPEIHILPNDGQIFFAKMGDQIVGCVAMVNMGDTGFELAKMAVSPETRGKGVGKKLCLAAIEYARQIGVKTIWLESNRVLTPALTMYASVGFREVPSVPTPYARADIRMEMTL
ncbi:bifunctional helix-turn-helix transcriptional regulator/GNAT family N-acetyltransferase [Spirosoma sp. KNUC1025]|uniref:bifunctional helix-turn-helix transcriptional regulator/GNAT family N-acetyltransferase n=1 Tax=Spirosoma sp. KNUC1025 TaxID=2894082 RepID=UPI003870D609|nr:bifunctional helix-turn-helix transcriptional regulator/GNAT family N-acetyltransferase [Spirosoma sp. KNUC1025]